MIAAATFKARRWFVLAPETWRVDLLRIVLGFLSVFGALVYVPSVAMALRTGMTGVIVLDTVALSAIIGLTWFRRLGPRLRATSCCLVLFVLGAGLMGTVGSVSQVFLFGFSIVATLLLSIRWGLGSVLLNVVTMLVVGWHGLQAQDMVVNHGAGGFIGWAVITSNFALVNGLMVVTVSGVISALEHALGRAVAAAAVLEHERKELVRLNTSLEVEVVERTRSEQSLRDSRALLRIAGLTARLGGWRLAVGAPTVEWSDEVCELSEVPAGTCPTLAEAIAFYVPESRSTVDAAVAACLRDGTPFDLEVEIVGAKGTRRWMRSIGIAVRSDAGTITHAHGSIQDITAQKTAEAEHTRLEEQLRQAQKMETVGNLAGGVAHDFNNLMSIVLSYSELLIEDLAPENTMRADVIEIREAGRRAAALTRQLLAFSRQQVLAPKVVSLSAVVHGMENMLRRLLGEDVQLCTSAGAGAGHALVDPGQLEQVVMNLAVNARDAMPRGGKLTIATSQIMLDARFAADHVGVTPGPHVMLAVTDNGSGMDKATQQRMFEPFFTTKEKGKGTGLGLATVFGIVRQSGGTIWVDSAPGRGTTFEIYFPVVARESSDAVATLETDPGTLRGKETILVVEDDERLRVLTRSILTRYGYDVLEAQNGGEAFLLCEQHPSPIHLLLTDVVMPRMSGRQLAERLGPGRPEMKVLYMSGYTDDAVVRHGILSATLAFIQKPITPEPLARKVRSLLDEVPLEAPIEHASVAI